MTCAAVPADELFVETTVAIAAVMRERLLADRPGGETLRDPADLKSGHASDTLAGGIARRALAGHRCNLVVEGEPPDEDPDAAFCVYLDPVDGSLNWDRGVGDAVGYLRAGYGGARRQLAHTLPLYLAARDLRAADNAATEFGEIARNAGHFLVEARGISEGFNLLAWPLVRAAGGVLRGLDGGDFVRAPFVPEAPLDYLLAGNRRLADDLLDRMQRFENSGRAAFEALMEPLQ